MPINIPATTVPADGSYASIALGSLYSSGYLLLTGNVDMIMFYAPLHGTGQQQEVSYPNLPGGQYSLAPGTKNLITGFMLRAPGGALASTVQYSLAVNEPTIPSIIPAGAGASGPFRPSGTVTWQHNDVFVASEGTADFEDPVSPAGGARFSVVDDPAHTRVKIGAVVIPGAWYYATPVAPASAPVGGIASAAFQNGWANSLMPDATYNPLRWRLRLDGVTEIVGSVDGGALGTTIVTLPAGFLPDDDVVLPIGSADGSIAMMATVNAASGNVVAVATSVASTGGITRLTSTGGTITVGSPTGPTANVDLPNSGAAAGTYGDSSHVSRVTVNAEGIITSVSSVAISGVPGGINQSYIGYNTIGGTTDAVGAGSYKQVFKKVTTGANACLLASVDLYVQGNASNVAALGVACYTDNAGSPGIVIAVSASEGSDGVTNVNAAMVATARWVSVPLGIWLAAATNYWIVSYTGSGATLFYDAGGSDQTSTNATTWVNELTTPSNSSRQYSLRGNTIS